MKKIYKYMLMPDYTMYLHGIYEAKREKNRNWIELRAIEFPFGEELNSFQSFNTETILDESKKYYRFGFSVIHVHDILRCLYSYDNNLASNKQAKALLLKGELDKLESARSDFQKEVDRISEKIGFLKSLIK